MYVTVLLTGAAFPPANTVGDLALFVPLLVACLGDSNAIWFGFVLSASIPYVICYRADSAESMQKWIPLYFTLLFGASAYALNYSNETPGVAIVCASICLAVAFSQVYPWQPGAR